MKLAIVVPSIRPESLAQFKLAWAELFRRHSVEMFVVQDGTSPGIYHSSWSKFSAEESAAVRYGCAAIHAEHERFLFNFNDGVRNIGFLAACKLVPDIDAILTLDDDVFPVGDPIQEHINALNMTVPISWFSTAFRADTKCVAADHHLLQFMRGFPYGVRGEAPVWVSHGVWTGVHDYDGPSQLVNGNPPVDFYKGPVPKGCLTPICGMNLAFRVEALPYVYFAPMGKKLGVQRFADIWMGIHLKRSLDALGKAMVSGYSTVRHLRASNVFANLEQEAAGIRINENYWRGLSEHPDVEGKYFQLYDEARTAWERVCKEAA